MLKPGVAYKDTIILEVHLNWWLYFKISLLASIQAAQIHVYCGYI